MTSQEMIDKIKKHYEEMDGGDYDDPLTEFAYGDEGEVPGLGKFTEIDSVGGEGEGETWYSVKHFSEVDRYVRVSGFYESYNGTTFDTWESDVSEVLPEKVIVTQWTKKEDS